MIAYIIGFVIDLIVAFGLPLFVLWEKYIDHQAMEELKKELNNLKEED